jgi:hypothetical protein
MHANLAIYADGQPVTVPPGAGIVAPAGAGTSALASNGTLTCLYALHVHDGEPNIIHVESPTQQTYTLGQFFDIWGQPLSRTQVLGHTTGATHHLVIDLFDGNGHLTPYRGDPRQLKLAAHETIALLYNSPKVVPTPFTSWNGL